MHPTKNCSLFIYLLVAIFGRQMALAVVSDEADGPIVHTRNGILRGIRMKTEQHYRDIFGFLGVPFIKPPIGKLRFKRPEPLPPWKGILNATWEGNFCPQEDFVWGSITTGHFYLGEEDCVQLNIFVPKTSKTKLPVMIVFPGGAFKEIGASMFLLGPGKFLEYDMILVTVNYRIGALGFLSTADGASPGNFGLLDQVEGMRWVRNNIEFFGGDPDEVTLCGFSAGGISVNLHLVSPLTKGLFKRVIMQSGTVFMPNFIHYHQLLQAQHLAAKFSCTNNNTLELVECLRGISAAKLTKAAHNIQEKDVSSEMPRFLPVVDGYYLTDIPHTLFFKGEYHKVPILLGALKHDGYYFFYRMMKNDKNFKLTDVHAMFRFFVQRANQFDVVPLDIKSLVLNEYFGRLDVTDQKAVTESFSELVTDLLFKAPIVHLLSYVLNTTSFPVYLYCFEERGSYGIMDVTETPNKTIVSHTDELQYLFTGIYSTLKMSPTSQQLSQDMVKMWYNFAVYGNPTPAQDPINWEAIKTDNMEYLRLSKDMTMMKKFRTDRMDMFVDIYVELKKRFPNQSNLIRGMVREIHVDPTPQELNYKQLLTYNKAKPMKTIKNINLTNFLERIENTRYRKYLDPTLIIAFCFIFVAAVKLFFPKGPVKHLGFGKPNVHNF